MLQVVEESRRAHVVPCIVKDQADRVAPTAVNATDAMAHGDPA